MKMIYASLLFAVALTISACNAKLSTNNDDKVDEQATKWPAYSEQALSGKVAGKDWKAVTAVARASTLADSVSVSFYSEAIPGACSAYTFSDKPYATIILPSAYTTTEYKTDYVDSLNAGSRPINFISKDSLGSITNSFAERTRLQITSIDSTGFQASVWAKATNMDNEALSSEVNGQIHVLDCRKQVPFTEWTALTGYYKLQSFDGITQDLRPLSIQVDSRSTVYDTASATYIRSILFPLYSSVSSGSDSQYSFGPMENLGVTKLTTTGTTKTLQYSFNGPIRYNGQNINLSLDMTAITQGQYLYVDYTLEVKGLAAKTSHKFTLIKSQ